MPSHLLPPGPKRLLRSENLRAFQQDQIGFFRGMAANHGPVSSFWLGPQRIVLVCEPDLIRQILTKDYASFRKGRFFELAKPFLGEGLLRSEGEHHSQMRKLIQPLFHRARIQDYGRTMVACGQTWNEGFRPGVAIDLAAEMNRLSLRIAGLTLLDTDLEAEAGEIGAALKVMVNLFVLVNNPLKKAWSRLPTPLHREIAGAADTLSLAIQAIIERQRREGPGQPNLIHHLMSVRDADGQGISDVQIRDEALTLFLAGHETMANAMAWTWHLLAQHPRVEALFHRELDTVLAGRAPGPEDINRLPYTRLILTESMRLYPPAWVLGRKAKVDYRLGDYALPAGTVLILSPWLLHHDSRFFSDPEVFRPERWHESFRASLPKFAYFPFGGGPRNCIGEAFAWMEGILLLATLGQRWRFRSIPGHPVALEPLVTLRPRHGLMMMGEERRGSGSR